MRKELIIDSVSSLNYGVWIAGNGAYAASAPDVSTVKIPGRNGDVVFSNRRFNNVSVSYPAFIRKGFETKFDEFRAFLYANLYYRRLEDSYHPDTYRLGRITGTMDPESIVWGADAGIFKITFDCKPQRFLKSGETVATLTKTGTINNPTKFDAAPLMVITGTGTIKINGAEIVIGSHSTSTVTIDFEAGEAYSGSTNLNFAVTAPVEGFPKLQPGNNTITLGSGITNVKITPRWWSL